MPTPLRTAIKKAITASSKKWKAVKVESVFPEETFSSITLTIEVTVVKKKIKKSIQKGKS